MQTKRKIKKTKASRQRSASSSLEKLAKSKMPKWRIVDERTQEQDTHVKPEADAVSPRLRSHREGALSGARMRKAALTESLKDSESKSNESNKSNENNRTTGLVNMLPDSEQDARLGAKTQVFEDDEHTGAQG